MKSQKCKGMADLLTEDMLPFAALKIAFGLVVVAGVTRR